MNKSSCHKVAHRMINVPIYIVDCTNFSGTRQTFFLRVLCYLEMSEITSYAKFVCLQYTNRWKIQEFCRLNFDSNFIHNYSTLMASILNKTQHQELMQQYQIGDFNDNCIQVSWCIIKHKVWIHPTYLTKSTLKYTT